MYFIDRYDTRDPKVGMSAGKAIEDIIDSSPDYYDGELESLRRKVNMTSIVLGKVIDCLTDEQQMRIIEAVGYKHEPITGEKHD